MRYVASPYSHDLEFIRHNRFLMVQDACMEMMRRDSSQVVFSPIVYGHQFAELIGGDFSSWKAFDLAMITIADEVLVLMMDGWGESVGVKAEIEFANAIGKPVRYIDPKTLD